VRGAKPSAEPPKTPKSAGVGIHRQCFVFFLARWCLCLLAGGGTVVTGLTVEVWVDGSVATGIGVVVSGEDVVEPGGTELDVVGDGPEPLVEGLTVTGEERGATRCDADDSSHGRTCPRRRNPSRAPAATLETSTHWRSPAPETSRRVRYSQSCGASSVVSTRCPSTWIAIAPNHRTKLAL
jgi:hypothetical protein